MRRGVVWAALAVVSLACFGALAGETHANGPAPNVSARVLRATASGASASFVVYMRHQADLSAAYAMKDQNARGWYVYRTLKAEAARSQAPLRKLLDARGVPYTSYWAANMIVARGDRAVVDELAARPDVQAIEADEKARRLEGGPLLPTVLDRLESTGRAATTEWGVQDVHAPDVWSRGFTGQGMVVASADTGVRWTHTALKNHYRGWNGTSADHNYNWHDAVHSGGGVCGANTVAPCDDDGHGSHTTGTAVGDDGAGNQIGVAPGAKWIGCRNMDRGTGSPATYTDCFQFFIAPTNLAGQNADPTKRPDVITDSWVCPASEGCAANTLQTIVDNTEASGIFVEASAGNGGPSCSTVSDPPAIYASAFSTGAVDSTNTLAGFSSRGPVTSDGSGRMKPDVVAPGVNVRSSTNGSDTSYANFSGTSMAGPHVAGVVALLWSARPDLVRNIAATKQLLDSTANPSVGGGGTGCGGSSVLPNNHFGWGLVDALAAVGGSGTSSPVLTVTKSGSGSGTVTSTPAGIKCGTTCSAAFKTGTTVTLKAAPAGGSRFDGWSGDCAGTKQCKLSMTTDHAATATFTRKTAAASSPCVVPRLRGTSVAVARRAVARAHCAVGTVTRAYSSRVKTGRVVAQRPVPGAHRRPGSRITLVVSKGAVARS